MEHYIRADKAYSGRDTNDRFLVSRRSATGIGQFGRDVP